jgi:hypothetical protein
MKLSCSLLAQSQFLMRYVGVNLVYKIGDRTNVRAHRTQITSATQPTILGHSGAAQC